MSNPTIDLLDTDIKKELKKAIGGKEEGLFAIGAGLLFNQTFGNVGRENESKEGRISRIVKEKYDFANNIIDGNTLSLEEQRNIISNIKTLQKKYMRVLDGVLDAKDKLMLANKAEESAVKYSLRM